MLSFSKIITLATVAFGTLSQAVPLTPRGGVPKDTHCLSTILVDVEAELKVAVGPIHALAGVATVAEVTPALDAVIVIINDAVGVVEALVDVKVEEVLAVEGGVLITVEALFDLVCAVLTVVFEALHVCIGLVGNVTGLIQIVGTLIASVSCLLKAIIAISVKVYGDALLVKLQAFIAVDVVATVCATLKIVLAL